MSSSSLPGPSSKRLRPGRLWMTRSRSSVYNEGPLAETAIAKDLEQEPDHDPDNAIDSDNQTEDESDSDLETLRQVTSNTQVSMVGSYRRPSFAGAGSRATVGTGFQNTMRTPTKGERKEAREAERSLLRDNRIIPPKHPRSKASNRSLGRRLSRHLRSSSRGASVAEEEGDTVNPQLSREETSAPSEQSPLLGDPDLPYGGQDSAENLDKKWEQAVLEGKIETTWQREAKVIGRYSAPLVLTFLLQYSLTVASIFTVGHLGKIELGAVSLASVRLLTVLFSPFLTLPRQRHI